MKDTNEYFRAGQLTVGTTAVQVPFPLGDGNKKGVLIKAHGTNDAAANTAPVFVGDAAVTSASGFSLAPGESIVVPISGEKDVMHAISSASSQVISWMVV